MTVYMRWSEGDQIFAIHKVQINKVWLGGLRCSGTEASILDCKYGYFGDYQCSGFYKKPDVVYCGAPYTGEDFSLRLIGDSDTKPSRVEVRLFGEWGTICNQNFDENDAKAICSQLDIGLPSMFASVASKGTYQSGTGRIWLTNITCGVYVTGFRGCSLDLAGGTCDHSQDAGVVCGTFPDIQTFRPPPIHTYNHHWLITGVSVGSAGFVFILGVILAFLRFRLWRSNTRPAAIPQANQYAVPSSAGFSTGYDYTPPVQSNKY
ncbi:scavenger receptor cysteine-rich type 1 protein M130-like [Liolophura sinensis]|uniref:scavenger receptor cysteine-rich type 1 protein M130-like n=1 Tax=Liolophura sinensis TaxID=3198878 RepID=UPI0031582F40